MDADETLNSTVTVTRLHHAKPKIGVKYTLGYRGYDYNFDTHAVMGVLDYREVSITDGPNNTDGPSEITGLSHPFLFNHDDRKDEFPVPHDDRYFDYFLEDGRALDVSLEFEDYVSKDGNTYKYEHMYGIFEYHLVSDKVHDVVIYRVETFPELSFNVFEAELQDGDFVIKVDQHGNKIDVTSPVDNSDTVILELKLSSLPQGNVIVDYFVMAKPSDFNINTQTRTATAIFRTRTDTVVEVPITLSNFSPSGTGDWTMVVGIIDGSQYTIAGNENAIGKDITVQRP